MKKALVGLALILWVLAGIQLWNLYGVRDQGKIVEAFHGSDFMNTESVIEGSGRLNTEYLSISGRKTMVQDIARLLGIKDVDRVAETFRDGQAETTLDIKAKQAETTIKIVSVEEEGGPNTRDVKQYLIVRIKLYEALDSAMGYKEKLDQIFDDYRIEEDVSLDLIGKRPGELTLEEKNQLTDDLLDMIDAKVMSEHRDTDLFTVYAYTKLIKDYDVRSGKQVNVNLAITYDEPLNLTNVYLSTPIIREDF